jgi:hypothetical protein
MLDPEFKAMTVILKALDGLGPTARRRVMHYVFDRVDPDLPEATARPNGPAELDEEG